LLRIVAVACLVVSVSTSRATPFLSISSCALVRSGIHISGASAARADERLLVPLGLCSYSLYHCTIHFIPELLHRIPVARGMPEPWRHRGLPDRVRAAFCGLLSQLRHPQRWE
jgi:hypothetical protein